MTSHGIDGRDFLPSTFRAFTCQRLKPRVATCTVCQDQEFFIDGSEHFVSGEHCAPKFEFLDRLIRGFFTLTMKNYWASAITI